MKILSKNYSSLVLFILFAFGANIATAQVKKIFTPRYNETISGDVTMIANNVLSRTATTDYNGEDGNHDFSDNVYVDIDNDPSTFNSSSANLSNPKPNAACLTIESVLLYWAAADKGNIQNGVELDNQPNWNFNEVKLMLPNQVAYTTIVADDIIYRGRDENPHFMNDPYICVKDITSDVQNLNNPFGKYQVANVEAKTGALTSHASSNTGTSGGWQMVVVYSSPSLRMKNITLFDGYAHIKSAAPSIDVLFDGFQTVPNGAVKADVVMGALEGDRDISGDKLQIKNVANTFVDLDAPLRDANNFFNSRITKGPSNGNNNFTDRNPASTNTLGFDASIFPLSNNGNSLITNNQTSATFRITSTQETYGLYLLGLAIEVYKPVLEMIVIGTPSSVTPQANPTNVNFNPEITNSGNDNAENAVLTTTIPPVATLVEPIIGLPSGVSYTFDTNTNVLTFNVANGVFDIGNP
ncbi:hypothetical protein N7U66_04240 [Lacinutrix neustonica]|uniref:Uncharacterized protein n=1 Tax=Lacinutrix neustonica TaxID=2980107 RepID=A0A9E8MZ07_9FLAO|nr:hypothetical protein [Lacinutrix neustonica]WAC02850.1 hypothetical protein N7U66_04240 [Lacinutrix neustonica]